MNIEELVQDLRDKGLNEEEIKEVLQKMKEDIEKMLNPKAEKEKEVEEEEKETEEEKMNSVFGY